MDGDAILVHTGALGCLCVHTDVFVPSNQIYKIKTEEQVGSFKTNAQWTDPLTMSSQWAR